METINRNRTKIAIALAAIALAILTIPLLDSMFGTHVAPMQHVIQLPPSPTAAPAPVYPAKNVVYVSSKPYAPTSLVNLAMDGSDEITHTKTISYDLDLLRLFNFQHGDVYPGNDDVAVSMETLDGDAAQLIVFDTSFDKLGETDQDKHANIGKGLAINKSDHSIHADGGAVITFTLTTETFVSDVQVIDLDHGSMRVIGYDANGNEVFHQSMSPDTTLVKTMPINTIVKTLAIRVKDSFVLVPHFRASLETLDSFNTLTITPEKLPETLGGCTSTPEEAAAYPDKPSCN